MPRQRRGMKMQALSVVRIRYLTNVERRDGLTGELLDMPKSTLVMATLTDAVANNYRKCVSASSCIRVNYCHGFLTKSP